MGDFLCEGNKVGCNFVGNNQNEVAEHQKSCFYFLGLGHFETITNENKELKKKVEFLTNEVETLKSVCEELMERFDQLMKGPQPTQPILNKSISSINECIQKKICTLSFTGLQYTDQKLYTCLTCNFTNGLCICASCFENCHKGHFVLQSDYTNGYCDCGVNQTVCCCVIPSNTTKTQNLDYAPSLLECQKHNNCTNKFTKIRYTQQVWYECYTCNLTGDKGCCASCVNTCHKGHDLKKSINLSEFICDCPDTGVCKA